LVVLPAMDSLIINKYNTIQHFQTVNIIFVVTITSLPRYEGTGRSLSLKLLQQLRTQAVPIGVSADKCKGHSAATGRALHEVSSVL